MKIEVIVQSTAKSLHGGPEVWVQVQSNDLLDWPRVQAALTEEQKNLLDRCSAKPVGYHPALVEGGDNNPYSFEDWWIFKATDDLAGYRSR